MYKKLSFSITGISPLICHNGQLSDPLNQFAKALKAVSGKRKKTDADYEEMSRIEWFGGLYLDENKRPVVPGVNIEAMLVAAGKKVKLGEAFKAGLLSDSDWPIEYEGPKDAEELFKKGGIKFTDRRGVVIGQSRIVRTRPTFRKWGLTFTVDYLPELLNEGNVKEAVATAGRIIGLCDFTPKYGRFEITEKA